MTAYFHIYNYTVMISLVVEEEEECRLLLIDIKLKSQAHSQIHQKHTQSQVIGLLNLI